VSAQGLPVPLNIMLRGSALSAVGWMSTKLRIIRSHMSAIELCKLNLETLILSVAEKFLPQLDPILTVPGIKTFSAISVISEIGVDMSVFPTSKHLCSWAALHRRITRALERRKPPAKTACASAYIKPLPQLRVRSTSRTIRIYTESSTLSLKTKEFL